MVERDCSNCRFHVQADPIGPFCFNCLMDPELPRWEPDDDGEEEQLMRADYVASIYKRHDKETMEEAYGD